MANDPVEALETAIAKVFPGAQISSRRHASRNATAIEVRFPRATGMDASSLSYRCPGWAFYSERPVMNELSAFLVDGPGMSGEALYVVFIPNDGSLRREAKTWEAQGEGDVGLPRAPQPKAPKTVWDRLGGEEEFG